MSYYYTRDHLGSVRELCDSSGSIVSRMAYDPYGRTTTVSGTILPTKQYAWYFQHQASGLALTQYRAYDSNTGRWLSRDPLEGAERSQGPNLYDYVQDGPITHIDPLGLKVYLCCAPIEQKGLLVSIGTAMGCRHCWLKTDTKEAGMGPSPPRPIPPGPPFGIPTEINNEAGDSKSVPGTTCTEIVNVDDACVNRELQVGQKTGKWGLNNNCNTLAQQILTRCSTCKSRAGRPLYPGP